MICVFFEPLKFTAVFLSNLPTFQKSVIEGLTALHLSPPISLSFSLLQCFEFEFFSLFVVELQKIHFWQVIMFCSLFESNKQ